MTLRDALNNSKFDSLVYAIRQQLWIDTPIFSKSPELAAAQRLRAIRLALSVGDATFRTV